MTNLEEKAAPAYPFAVPPLRYGYGALMPFVDGDALRFHHDVHHRGHVDRLNSLLATIPALHGQSIEAILRNIDSVPGDVRAKVRHEGGGHANHQFLWKILGRNEGQRPSGALEQEISGQFGGLEQFKTAFKTSAMNHEGDGWTFLVLDRPLNGRLEIISLPENQSVLSIGKLGILCCDLWEHAFNGQHPGGKGGWLDSFWEVVA